MTSNQKLLRHQFVSFGSKDLAKEEEIAVSVIQLLSKEVVARPLILVVAVSAADPVVSETNQLLCLISAHGDGDEAEAETHRLPYSTPTSAAGL